MDRREDLKLYNVRRRSPSVLLRQSQKDPRVNLNPSGGLGCGSCTVNGFPEVRLKDDDVLSWGKRNLRKISEEIWLRYQAYRHVVNNTNREWNNTQQFSANRHFNAPRIGGRSHRDSMQVCRSRLPRPALAYS